MVYSCGIDIEEINRFDKHYFQNGLLSNLIYDIFTSREIENFSYFGKKAFLKGFCFKEAFYKAINSNNVGWFDVEILFSNDGLYEIHTSELLNQIIEENKISITDVQFSETNQYITCKVLLIK
jgi:phosphopantetheine--protein transferase-like protein